MNHLCKAGWVAACVVAVALGACRSASTRIYTLEPAAPAPPASHVDVYHAPPLRIDTLSVPAGWDRIEILRQSAPGALQISDFDHWAAPLAQMARQTLSDDLDRRLPSGSVIFPRLPKSRDALGVNVDILDFNIVSSQASMRASWIMGAKRGIATLRSAMSSGEPAAVARAWSDLIGQLADRIAADAVTFDNP